MKNTIHTIAILAICFFFSFQSVKAMTGDISGQVIEKETNTPVAFAEITLDNGTTKTVVSANEYGYYSVKHLTTGKYQMSVKYNNRTFVMNKVKIHDSYTMAVNFIVSNSNQLSTKVEVVTANNEVKEKSAKASTTVKQLPVNPAQRPAKTLQAHKNSNNNVIDVNPIKIYSIRGQRA